MSNGVPPVRTIISIARSSGSKSGYKNHGNVFFIKNFLLLNVISNCFEKLKKYFNCTTKPTPYTI